MAERREPIGGRMVGGFVSLRPGVSLRQPWKSWRWKLPSTPERDWAVGSCCGRSPVSAGWYRGRRRGWTQVPPACGSQSHQQPPPPSTVKIGLLTRRAVRSPTPRRPGGNMGDQREPQDAAECQSQGDHHHPHDCASLHRFGSVRVPPARRACGPGRGAGAGRCASGSSRPGPRSRTGPAPGKSAGR